MANYVVEALRKTPDLLELGWKPDETLPPSTTVVQTNYKLYVGPIADTGSMVFLKDVGSNPTQSYTTALGKIYTKVTLAEIQTALGTPAGADFTTLTLYFLNTSVNDGVESAIGDSPIGEVPPVGINNAPQRDDHTIDRHMWGFDADTQRWYKLAVTDSGAIVVGTDSLASMSNEIKEMVYNTNGTVDTMKIYASDATSGAAAKLVSYEYTDALNPLAPTSITVSDSTV